MSTDTKSPRLPPKRPHAGASFQRKVDRDELYEYLWKRSDRKHRIRIHKSHLASALGVANHTISVIINTFIEEGKLLRVGTEKNNVAVYAVTDPATFNPKDESTWTDGKQPSAPKAILWG